MLILGDSGSGKSTFNKHLELVLLQSYTRGGRIPLFINLPAIDRPDKELITEQLRAYSFTESQIQELKQHRQFILISAIVPFSKLQIQDYVEQYVPLEPRTWTTQDYMEKLTTIPNLMDI
ncbi:hypothetical protein BGX24_008008, partial [Mortierella sp. AD032]